MNNSEWISQLPQLLSGMGLFYLGVLFLSDGFQRISGFLVHRLMNSLTAHSFKSLGVGFFLTLFLQSSSTASVMTVSFVNGGLLELTQAMGFLLGANLGGTAVIWWMTISSIWVAPILIFLGVILQIIDRLLLFSSREQRFNGFATVFWGAGLLLLGLHWMGQSLEGNLLEQLQSLLVPLNVLEFPSVLTLLISGVTLALLMGSSTMAIGVVIVVTAQGLFSLPAALIMVFAANVGTTAAVLRAGASATVRAKRLALAQFSFKFLGSLIFAFMVFQWLLPNWNWQGLPLSVLPFYIAAFHTGFNLFNILLFLPLVSLMERFLTRLIPDKNYKEKKRLQALGGVVHTTPALALEQSEQEIKKLVAMVQVLLDLTRSYFNAHEEDSETLHRVRKYENITDNIQKEVTEFLENTMQVRLTREQSRRVQRQLFVVSDLEHIADACESVVEAVGVRFRKKITYDTATQDKVIRILGYLQDIFEGYFSRVTDDGKSLVPDAVSIRWQKSSCDIESLVRDLRENSLVKIEGKEEITVLRDILDASLAIRKHTIDLIER